MIYTAEDKYKIIIEFTLINVRNNVRNNRRTLDNSVMVWFNSASKFYVSASRSVSGRRSASVLRVSRHWKSDAGAVLEARTESGMHVFSAILLSCLYLRVVHSSIYADTIQSNQ